MGPSDPSKLSALSLTRSNVKKLKGLTSRSQELTAPQKKRRWTFTTTSSFSKMWIKSIKPMHWVIGGLHKVTALSYCSAVALNTVFTQSGVIHKKLPAIQETRVRSLGLTQGRMCLDFLHWIYTPIYLWQPLWSFPFTTDICDPNHPIFKVLRESNPQGLSDHRIFYAKRHVNESAKQPMEIRSQLFPP